MPPSTIPISRTAATTSGNIVDASVPLHNEAHSTGISWAAVAGGAFVTASMSLILLALGTGLGLTAISPLSGSGATASAIGRTAIAWLIFTQIIAAALGGYLAGRLRTKWVDVHTDEVYFRDTAHGLLVWAVGLVVSVAFLGAAATSLAGGTAQRNFSANANASPREQTQPNSTRTPISSTACSALRPRPSDVICGQQMLRNGPKSNPKLNAYLLTGFAKDSSQTRTALTSRSSSQPGLESLQPMQKNV